MKLQDAIVIMLTRVMEADGLENLYPANEHPDVVEAFLVSRDKLREEYNRILRQKNWKL